MSSNVLQIFQTYTVPFHLLRSVPKVHQHWHPVSNLQSGIKVPDVSCHATRMTRCWYNRFNQQLSMETSLNAAHSAWRSVISFKLSTGKCQLRVIWSQCLYINWAKRVDSIFGKNLVWGTWWNTRRHRVLNYHWQRRRSTTICSPQRLAESRSRRSRFPHKWSGLWAAPGIRSQTSSKTSGATAKGWRCDLKVLAGILSLQVLSQTVYLHHSRIGFYCLI